ncbi:Smg-4/UPF3 family-domain-containing protein [Fennellomyces sp. T-0311]|nr:Smg-4/UPF3 family-domain-containing protein [Fennellomyces sp. T-0311]
MKSLEGVIEFHQIFDGHIFIDSKGTEHRAVVEFAPYQKLPKAHKNPDVRQGTIDEDPEYLKFVESLKEAENKPSESKDVGEGASQLERLENRLAHVTAQNLAAEQANKPTTTPLLEHLRAKKAAEAASKAKAQAAKAAKKKAAKAEAKKKEKEAKTNSEEGAATPAKKPARTRNRKKKEDKEVDGDAKPKDDKKKGKPPAKDPNAKPDKPKKPRPKKDPKGKQVVDKQGKQQVVSILGRQQPGDNKPKTQQQQQRAG